MIDHKNYSIYLASRSPRRRKLLQQIGLEFESFAVELFEEFHEGEKPEEMVLRLAEEKMDLALKEKNDGIIITADTIVYLDGRVLGKPSDREEAYKYLSLLSGRTHTVFTSFIINNCITGRKNSHVESTEVVFQELSEKEIYDYIDTGSPMDKAGGYGIQDEYGAVFIKRIDGCFYNVMGLPISALYQSLKEIV